MTPDYLDPLTGSRQKPEPQRPPDFHDWKIRPTGDPDADGYWPFEVYSDALGHISDGKVKP